MHIGYPSPPVQTTEKPSYAELEASLAELQYATQQWLDHCDRVGQHSTYGRVCRALLIIQRREG